MSQSERRVLVTGAGGLLGPYLVDAARARGHVFTTTRTGGDHPCDLSDRRAVESMLQALAPNVVIHAAAMTNVDACESSPEKADAANRATTVNLASALGPNERLVLISTDQVYADRSGPHVEGSEAPVNVYGRTKLAGERAAGAHPNALVLRTNLFGRSKTKDRPSLSDFVADSLANDRPITLFRDVFFSPLHMATLAELVWALLDLGATGTYNLGCREGMSKGEFGLSVARHLGLQTRTVTLGDSTTLPHRAPRARDLRLDVRRVERILGRPMPTLTEEIGKL